MENFDISIYEMKNEAQKAFLKQLHEFNEHMLKVDKRVTQLTKDLLGVDNPLGLIDPENIKINVMKPP